jgi:hypothetical protein
VIVWKIVAAGRVVSTVSAGRVTAGSVIVDPSRTVVSIKMACGKVWVRSNGVKVAVTASGVIVKKTVDGGSVVIKVSGGRVTAGKVIVEPSRTVVRKTVACGKVSAGSV